MKLQKVTTAYGKGKDDSLLPHLSDCNKELKSTKFLQFNRHIM